MTDAKNRYRISQPYCIAENFDPRLLDDPKVSERDGHFYVFDGQHTIEALRILNGNKELSIRIRLYQHMTAKDEAILFAKQFGDAESVSAGSKMRALIFAENAKAVSFYKAVQSVGFDLDYSHKQGNNRIGCIATAFREFQRLDADCFYEVLTLIRDAWDGDAEFFRSEVFTALCRFVVQYRGEYDRHRLVSRLRMAGPMDIYDGGRNVSLPEDFDKLLATMRSRNVFVSIIIQNIAQLKNLFEKQLESILGNCDELLYLSGNETGTHKMIAESYLGKQTIDMNTYGKSSGRSGNYSTNWQITGRELLDAAEVRMLDNRYALLFIRGEMPIMDEKYDLLNYPNVRFTPEKGGAPYVHGGTELSVGSLSLSNVSGTEPKFINLSDFIFGMIRAVGMILLGWGIVQVGLSFQSHDPSQRSNGFLTLAGGVIITFAKEILTLITG